MARSKKRIEKFARREHLTFEQARRRLNELRRQRGFQPALEPART